MKHHLLILAILPFLCTGCFLARIVTVSPEYEEQTTYTTTVTVPKTRTVTTTTCVTATSEDISLCLDLKAVAAAFAQSSNVQEFEAILNNSSYMLSNLDLNRDGFVDYLRVLETVDNRAHVFIIQAVLARDIYQDVAYLTAEVNVATPYVQIIGSNYLYGPKYIVRPVFIATPAIFVHLRKTGYSPWRSPWYWDHFPSHYKKPAPILINHYKEYVHTFTMNHRYCHEVMYENSCHYPQYESISSQIRRNDYEVRYPETSFTVRNANTPLRTSASTSTPTTAQRTVTNAKDIDDNREATVTRTTTTTTASRTSGTSSGNTRTTATTAASKTGSTGTTTTSRTTATTAASTPSSTTSSSSSSTGKTTATTGTTATSGRTSSSTSSSTGTTTTATRRTTTTNSSRVNTSGTSSTRISTVTPSGTESTVKRTATSSASRSSASTGSTSGTTGSRTTSTTSASRTR